MKKRVSVLLVCLLVLSLSVTVIAGSARATEDLAASISLPAALVKGESYYLPVPAAGSSEVSITVNGEAYTAPFVAEGTQAEIGYTAADGTAIGSYTLPVVDTNSAADQTAYFYATSGSVSAVKNENDVALSFASDARVSFIKELSSEDLAVYLSFVEGASNFETVTVKLTDSIDGRNSLTFSIDMAAGSIRCGNASASLEEMDDVLKLRYKNATGKLMLDDQPLLSCDSNDSGEQFMGFKGGAYLTLGFEGVSGNSTVRVTRVSNQALGHKNSTTADMAEPVLAITSELVSTQYMGDTFQIPSYRIYDVLSQVTESSVTVEAPNGDIYTEAFPISQYGKYKLTFAAEDSFGNRLKTVKMIFVNDDIAPELSVTEMEKTSYKLGDTVQVPTYTVSDNLDAACVDVILILPNYEIRLLTHDAAGEITYCISDVSMYSKSFINDNSSFKAEQEGSYTIRYVAYDDQYNRTVKELVFTVE